VGVNDMPDDLKPEARRLTTAHEVTETVVRRDPDANGLDRPVEEVGRRVMIAHQ
jgi:hypothetical protein